VPFTDLAADPDDQAPSFAPERFRGRVSLATGHWRVGAGPAPWDEQPAERLAATETMARIRQAIAELPDRQRAVISLRDVDGWTGAEVCDLLDLSEANQRVLLHRARARVRQALEDQYAEREP